MEERKPRCRRRHQKKFSRSLDGLDTQDSRTQCPSPIQQTGGERAITRRPSPTTTMESAPRLPGSVILVACPCQQRHSKSSSKTMVKAKETMNRQNRWKTSRRPRAHSSSTPPLDRRKTSEHDTNGSTSGSGTCHASSWRARPIGRPSFLMDCSLPGRRPSTPPSGWLR